MMFLALLMLNTEVINLSWDYIEIRNFFLDNNMYHRINREYNQFERQKGSYHTIKPIFDW